MQTPVNKDKIMKIFFRLTEEHDKRNVLLELDLACKSIEQSMFSLLNPNPIYYLKLTEECKTECSRSPSQSAKNVYA